MKRLAFIAVATVVAYFLVPKDLVLAFAGGLIVGWNFLDQPQFVKDIVARIRARFGSDDDNPPLGV